MNGFENIKERVELREKFRKETGNNWENSQGEPDIDYVLWLESKQFTESQPTDDDIRNEAKKILISDLFPQLEGHKIHDIYPYVESDILKALVKCANFARNHSTPPCPEIEWVSVKDRLPKEDGNCSIPCLVFSTNNGRAVRYFNEFHECWDDEHGDDFYSKPIDHLVTHWMPLPKPPKT